jgi:hypothetical protein
MRSRNVIACCLLFGAGSAQAQSSAIAPELWDRPRSARAVLAEAAVKQAVSGYLAQSGPRLVIQHGPAQESVLQAEELRSWLVALAVEPQRIALRGDLKPGEALRIGIVPAP